jgi:hydroxymethylbilane synthase
MASRVLKLGTRRSTLARVQSAIVARNLEQLHPGLRVELTGIETRGDRILDKPLWAIEGKEFFTAELDTALHAGDTDLTVHSYKDLSLERPAQFLLAAVPRREQPRDIVLFAPDVAERLTAGHELLIGSSSPRRLSFVPDFLQRVLPPSRDGSGARVRLVELRGNVDSRLRRLQEQRGSARHMDGVVLAFAGLARLWSDPASQILLRELFTPLRRMVLPLSACPAAPAQGALAIECRRDDADTAALLQRIDHPPTRRAIDAERALLAARGGGCHQRFGATQVALGGLGELLYLRDAEERDGVLQIGAPQLRWRPEVPLATPSGIVRPWDGSRAMRTPIEPLQGGIDRSAALLPTAEALFVAHRRALPEAEQVRVNPAAHVWVPGLETWQAMARRGIWVEGCAEGLGFAALEPLLQEPLLQLPPLERWVVLTHLDAAAGWPVGEVISTYRHGDGADEDAGAPPPDATHLYWHSGAQFERWGRRVSPGAQHGCGPGKTYEHLQRAGVQNARMFPQVTQWRDWLGL